jgi:hypothetical protein
VFLLNPHFAYNLGIQACSIFFNCYLDKKDCDSAYSIASFHTDRYSILFSALVPPH